VGLPPTGGKLVYSAKFLCGFQADGSVPVDPSKPVSALPLEPPVKPGNYATEINVHNPQETPAAFVKKAVLSGFTGPGVVSPPEQPFPPGALHTPVLEPDFALEIDCPDIATLLGPTLPPEATFIKGFVVITSQRELDVVAVYTAERVDEHKNVECLLANGKVVEATLQADGTRKCPKGTVSIGVGQGTGTGMTMDVEYITPKWVWPPPPPPTPTPTPTETPTPTPKPALNVTGSYDGSAPGACGPNVGLCIAAGINVHVLDPALNGVIFDLEFVFSDQTSPWFSVANVSAAAGWTCTPSATMLHCVTGTPLLTSVQTPVVSFDFDNRDPDIPDALWPGLPCSIKVHATGQSGNNLGTFDILPVNPPPGC